MTSFPARRKVCSFRKIMEEEVAFGGELLEGDLLMQVYGDNFSLQKRFQAIAALNGNQDDFSSNARTDNLEKYSRFHGKTAFSVWCNSPDVKYIDSFRDLLFQINPHHITCVYKKMFETSAISNLRLVDGYSFKEEVRAAHFSPAGFRSDTNVESDYPGYFQEHVDKCNSCVYSAGASSKTQSMSKGSVKRSAVHGWDICYRPHATYNIVYQKTAADETHNSSRRHGKPGYRAMSPSFKSFPAILRVNRNTHHGNMCRSASPGENGRTPSRGSSTTSRDIERPDSGTRSSSSAGCIGNSKTSPIKIGRRFRHFENTSCYIDQYRKEYTYRRLVKSFDASPLPSNDSSTCSCGNGKSARARSMTSSNCIKRWYPNKSHLVQSKSASTCEKNPCITSAIPVPKRKPVLKTRPAPSKKRKAPYALQVPVINDKPRQSSSLGFHRDGIPRFDFFSTILTVNNYNPVTTPPSQAHKTRCHSSSSVILSCDRASACEHTNSTCSPVNVTISYNHLLNQNLRGSEQ